MKKTKTKINSKDLDKFLGDFLPRPPEIMEDGSIRTARWLTGINSLDLLLNGGFPQGHTIAFGAEPGVGKTTTLIQALGNIVEKYDKKCYYLDVEGGATYELIYDMGYSNLLWHPETNPNGKFYLLSIDTIQQLARILKQVTADPDTAVVVLDSDTNVIDQTNLEEDDLGTSNRAAASNARMWSLNGKNLQTVVKNSNITFVLVHQARVDLSGFRPKVSATGGNAAKHMASAEIWGRRKAWIDENFNEVKQAEARGALIVLSTSKNRLTKPFSSIELPIIFGRGVSNKWSYRKWLEDSNVVNNTTGEVTKALSMKGGGFYTLTLPSGEYKARGDKEVWPLIDEHYDEIVSYVNANGGFTLGKAEPETYEVTED